MSICYLPKGKVGLNHLKEKEEGLISFGTSFGGAGLGGAAPGGSLWEFPAEAVGGLDPATVFCGWGELRGKCPQEDNPMPSVWGPS